METQLKEIEIPLGAKDSELCGWEYTIPDNKYRITGGIDWFSAFYQCRHILRIVDWSKYVIEFEIW